MLLLVFFNFFIFSLMQASDLRYYDTAVITTGDQRIDAHIQLKEKLISPKKALAAEMCGFILQNNNVDEFYTRYTNSNYNKEVIATYNISHFAVQHKFYDLACKFIQEDNRLKDQKDNKGLLPLDYLLGIPDYNPIDRSNIATQNITFIPSLIASKDNLSRSKLTILVSRMLPSDTSAVYARTKRLAFFKSLLHGKDWKFLASQDEIDECRKIAQHKLSALGKILCVNNVSLTTFIFNTIEEAVGKGNNWDCSQLVTNFLDKNPKIIISKQSVNNVRKLNKKHSSALQPKHKKDSARNKPSHGKIVKKLHDYNKKGSR